MSLLYGGVYIIRFGAMRKTHKAAEWADVSVLLVIGRATLSNCLVRKRKKQALLSGGTSGLCWRCQLRGLHGEYLNTQ